ncbi:MAG: UbiA family prenyltransferase [Candidatus Aenigmatarchaeota archaeon]
MLAYIEITRPVNCLMASIAVLIGGLLVEGINQQLLLAALIAFLITAGGNTLNDYIDIEADRVNRPKRPIPSGRIKEEVALIFSFLLFILGISLSTFINPPVLAIAALNSVLLVLYSTKLKRKLLLGNLIIGWLVGSTFIFGGAVFSNILLPGFLAMLAGLTTLTREIIKGFEDIEGDKKAWLKVKSKGIAERFKIDKKGVVPRHTTALLSIACLCMLCAIILSPLPWLLGLLSQNYIFVVFLADVCFMYVILAILFKKNWSLASKGVKVGMAFGLLAFLGGLV